MNPTGPPNTGPTPLAFPRGGELGDHICAGDQPRILVADDAGIRQEIAGLLAGRFRVETVPDGEAALAAARRERPDLILTDVAMPRLDGFGLLREIRADSRLSEVPVILLSARTDEESQVDGMEEADDYLIKPFGARELLARVKAHIRMARLRQEAQETLRTSEEQFRTLFELMDEGYSVIEVMFDTEGRATDYRLLEVNPAFEKHTGLSGVVGRTARELVPTLEAIWFETYGRVAITGEPTRFVSEAKGLGGRWFDVNAFRLGGDGSHKVAVLFTDITARKKAEGVLRESEAYFRSMADNSPSMLWVTDREGQCTYVSRQWCEYTGTSFEQNLGLGWLVCIHPEDRDEAREVFLRATQEARLFTCDYRVRRHDGEYRWGVDVGQPRLDERGEFQGYVGTITDIHDRRLAEGALREADRQKDEFLATLAHELRNPLAPISNGLQVMKLAGSDCRAVERLRAMMERQVAQMARLIDDLMDVSRISRGKIILQKTRIRLSHAIADAIETCRPLIERQGHELALDVSDESIFVEGDATRLTQVFANLLNNAAKYTEPRGRIRLVVERQGCDVIVSVEDTGVGIAAEMLPKVFDLFSQVDRSLEKSQGGLGIGLNIVKRLVEMHGGSITAESGGHGRGSRFCVRLPVALSVTTDRSADADGPRCPNAGRRRILVVDDNQDGAMSLADLLDAMGNQTQIAHDGLEALAVVEVFRPDVILMDIGMPKLNGYDTCRRIRQQPWGKNIVIVAQTGWGQEDDKKKSQEAGFDFHMIKPVNPLELERLLASARATTG
jgi:PAS domain S-box-containing protein